MRLIYHLAIAIIFLLAGCSHIQKIHFYNSEALSSRNMVEKPALKWRSVGCPLLPIPWDINSIQSKAKIADAGEDFQLSVTVDLAPLTLWKDVYWWGPLWLPIFPTFLFSEKSSLNELSIKIEYTKNWNTEFKENNVEMMHKRSDEVQRASFPSPNQVVIRFLSESGRSEAQVVQGSEKKYINSDTQYYKYTLNLNNSIPETFEVDVELKGKIHTFILKKEERWQFALYTPFYCGLN